MVGQAAAWGTPWQLLYGGRSADSMAFLGELRDHPDNVRLYPEDRAGRIPLHEWLDRPPPDTTVYACGPEKLLTAVENGAARWGPGAVRLERFRPRPKAARVDTEVEVVCARSNRTVTVPAGRSILSGLEDAGLPVTGSCREGVCGTCETRVLDGEPDHRDDILTADGRAAGDRMYLCVSRGEGDQRNLADAVLLGGDFFTMHVAENAAKMADNLGDQLGELTAIAEHQYQHNLY
ncbi:iron-sulfur cluster-binding domain-containing protein [Streptomyces sp. NPDC048611]|uniref:flavin reductase family protein n=1 Tax=Streptomyces sp. NPDC048611 TaxID=3155635 RepID=UPI00341AD77B